MPYTTSSHVNLTISANDSTLPVFVSIIATPAAVINGSDVIINANVEDNVQVDSTWANITLPDNSSHFISVGSLPYTYTTNVSQIGTHIVTFYANDSSGNNATTVKTFTTAPPVNLTIDVNVGFGVTSDIDLIVYLRGTTDVIATRENLNGSESILLPDVPVDLFFNTTFGNDSRSTTINNFNLSASTGGEISFSDPTVSGYLTVYAVNTSFTFDNASVEISYENSGYSDEANLQLHKCDNFNMATETCLSGFNEITSSATHDTDNDKFTYVTTSFSGFGIKQYVAPTVTETSSTGSGGGGGGCAPGYELVDDKCVKIVVSEEIQSQLIDITFALDDLIIQSSDELVAIVTFESFGTESTPVNLTFIILDESGNEVYRVDNNITVTTEEVMRWNYETLGELPEGKYIAVLHTLYNIDVFDEFTQEFEIGKRKGITGRIIEFIETVNPGEKLWYVLVFVLSFSFIIIFWHFVKRHKKRKNRLNNKYTLQKLPE